MKPFKYFLLVLTTFTVCLNAQWTNTGGPPSSRINQSLATNGLNIFSGTNGGMVRSTQGGGNWLNIDNGLTSININTVKYFTDFPNSSGSLFAGSGKVFWSTNNGDLWNVYPNDTTLVPDNPIIYSLLNHQNKIWIGTSKGVYYQQGLDSWVSVNSGFPYGNFIKVYSLIDNGNNIFAGSDRGIYKLVDTTWFEKNNGLPNTFSYTLGYTNGHIFTGGGLFTSNVYVSTDEGENWSLSLTEPAATSILTIGSNIFVATYGDGVWRSTNYGSNWSQINDGVSVSVYKLFSVAKNDQDLFIGTESVGVWKRPLSQIVTDVEVEKQIPTEFSLKQNYPNPFNPSTKIKFNIPTLPSSSPLAKGRNEVGFVTLKVYDVLGNEIATLIDEYKPAGSYDIEFDAANLPSGVYFYRLQTGSFVETKNMILLK